MKLTKEERTAIRDKERDAERTRLAKQRQDFIRNRLNNSRVLDSYVRTTFGLKKGQY